MNRPSPARIVVAASSLALVGLTVIAPDVGAATGSYSATVAFYDGTGHRTAVVAGTPVEAVIALKNTSTGTTPASLGSANITLPTPFAGCLTPACAANPVTDTSGFTAAFQSHTLQLRSGNTTTLAAGSTVTITAWVTLPLRTTCTLTPWTLEVRPSHTFSGTSGTDLAGNPAPLLGYLKFTQEPPVATAASVGMDPHPIVTSYDGCGGDPTTPPTVTLSGAPISLSGGNSGVRTGSVTDFSGVTFSDFDQTDRLTATAGDNFTSATSTPFLVAQTVHKCDSLANCNPVSVDDQQTGAVINPVFDSNHTDALVSGSARIPDTTMCNEGAGGSGLTSSQVSSTISVDAPVSKTLTMTIQKALVLAISNNGTPFMGVCMRTLDALGSNVDIELPNCPTTVTTSTAACVLSRGKNKANEIIAVHLPAGDPHFNVH